MPAERFYVCEDLIANQRYLLKDQEFHHLAHVMRAQEGDSVELVNGRGGLAQAAVVAMEKKQAVLQVDAVSVAPAPDFQMILAQAIPRLNRLDFILEKGTELGMTQLWLFPSQHSERKEFTEHQLERMKAVTISAMKQCGRLYLPEIVLKGPLKQWKAPSYACYFGDLDPEATVYSPDSAKKDTLFFIGPESGFTAEEVQLLRTLQAKGIKLHSNVLRTDTAALVALTLMSQG